MAPGYQVLARKYRPQRFADVIGQEHATSTLKNALTQRRIAHGYIFSGHRGIGKTTVARILAMALNCRGVDGLADGPTAEPCGVCDSCVEIRAGNSVDVMEIDAATNRGIDEVRELREAARYRPARDRYKIWILDEAHQITEAAFNALLKTLEEPPSHVVFMLATTQPEDIPQTIRSRCQHFSFRAVGFEQIVGQLRGIVEQEGLSADEDALALLAEAGDGSVRDALSLMDQAIAGVDGHLSAAHVRQLVGSAPSTTLEELMASVERGSSQEVLERVDVLLAEGQNPSHFAKQMVRFLRNAVVAKVAGSESALLQISSEERERVGRVAAMFGEEDLTRHLQIMLRTHGELGYRQEGRFHLELGLLKLVHAQRLLPLEQLLSGSGLPARTGAGAASSGSGSASGQRSGAASGARSDGQRDGVASAAPAVAVGQTQRVSPFAADSARKGNLRSGSEAGSGSGGDGNPRAAVSAGIAGSSSQAVILGSAAPAVQEAPRFEAKPAQSPSPSSISVAIPQSVAVIATEPATAETTRGDGDTLAAVREAVWGALEQAGQSMVVGFLEEAEWTIADNELVLRLAIPEAAVAVTFGPQARKVAAEAASVEMGTKVILTVCGGSDSSSSVATSAIAPRTGATGSARARALQDPVVRRMQEKFGAEIRTVVDHQKNR